jgi:hypothetical protein
VRGGGFEASLARAKLGYDPLFEYFDQPGGLLPACLKANPAAENLQNLDAGYYIISAAGQPEDYVRRMIRNEWGASVSGERVYQTFRAERHVPGRASSRRPGQVLRLGLDGGGTPAAVIGGRDSYGRRIIYDEVVLTDPADPRARPCAPASAPSLRQGDPRR